MRSYRSFFSDLLNETNKHPDYQVAALKGLWIHLAGQKIAAQSQPVCLHNFILTVEATSPRWAQELSLLEDLLIEKINQFWGNKLIDQIEFKTHLKNS